jgi:hypothetical protein
VQRKILFVIGKDLEKKPRFKFRLNFFTLYFQFFSFNKWRFLILEKNLNILNCKLKFNDVLFGWVNFQLDRANYLIIYFF